jgi:hypothetical protein
MEQPLTWNSSSKTERADGFNHQPFRHVGLFNIHVTSSMRVVKAAESSKTFAHLFFLFLS